MKINSFALLGILVLPLVLFTLNSGCSGKLRDAEEHYDIAPFIGNREGLMMLSKNIIRQQAFSLILKNTLQSGLCIYPEKELRSCYRVFQESIGNQTGLDRGSHKSGRCIRSK